MSKPQKGVIMLNEQTAPIDAVFWEEIENALDLGFRSFGEGDHAPFVILSKRRGKGVLIDLKNVEAVVDEALVDSGRNIILQFAQTGRHYVLVWDGYLTVDGQRADAVFAEAGQAGADTGLIFAQRYRQTTSGKLSKIGKPALVAEASHLWSGVKGGRGSIKPRIRG